MKSAKWDRRRNKYFKIRLYSDNGWHKTLKVKREDYIKMAKVAYPLGLTVEQFIIAVATIEARKYLDQTQKDSRPLS